MTPVLGKADIVEQVAEKTGLTKKDAAAALEAALDSIASWLQRGAKVRLTGFGVFEVRSRKARRGMNMATKQIVEIPAGKVPVFKASKTLKEAIK